ncbi:MAG: flagellin N-terminal helical domain-containing protein [Desulfuromonadaceae bacterium]
MRVTQNMSADTSIYHIQQGRAKLDRLQELTASGTAVNRPSDDPINTRLLLDIVDKVKATDQYSSNITKSGIWQQFTSTALTGMSDTLQQAQKLAGTISDGVSDPALRNSVVSQLQALKQQMIDMGNMQTGDQYIFGGANNDTPPFTNSPAQLPPPAPQNAAFAFYSGDESNINVEIGNNAAPMAMNILGNQILTADTATSQNYGTTNILQAFDDMIYAVQGNDVTGIRDSSQAFGDGAKQIFNAITDVGSRITRLESFTKMNENTRNTLMTVYSNTQNVDYAKLGVELSQQQIAFEASLSATAKLSQLSLLDYM